jgi:hypothetical protein
MKQYLLAQVYASLLLFFCIWCLYRLPFSYTSININCSYAHIIRSSSRYVSELRNWDFLKTFFLFLRFWQAVFIRFCLHCKDTVPKIAKRYSQKENCEASVPIHISVSDLYIPKVGLHSWLQQNSWTDPGKIHKSLTDVWIWKLGTRSRSLISGNT